MPAHSFQVQPGASPSLQPAPAIRQSHSSAQPTVGVNRGPGEAESAANIPPRPLSAEEVFRDFAPRVYGLARQVVGNDVDAEDVTAAVLLDVIRAGERLPGEPSLTPWLDHLIANAALALRHERASCDPQVTRSELARRIEAATEALPKMYREAFVLADVEGLPNATVGERLGLNLSEVNSRLHAARLLMREALD